MIVNWPLGTSEIIKDIIEEIGRPVTFYTVWSSQACAVCSLDPVTNTSTDSFCPVCSGVYWTPIYSGYTFTAHVNWKFADYNDYTTGGITYLGDCKVKIHLSGIAEQVVNDAEYAIVDSRRTSIEKITILGVPTPNRVIVDLKEENDVG